MSREGKLYSAFAAEVVSRVRLPGMLGIARTVDSTNRMAARLVRGFDDRGAESSSMVLVAWHQSRGRGRRQRRWVTEAGEAIATSILTRLEDPAAVSMMPLLAGVALAEWLRDASGIDVMLKWPNDLYVGDAKLGGVLAEAAIRGRSAWVILGFGINHGTRLPPISGRKTTSLLLEHPETPSLGEVTADSIHAVLALLESGPAREEVVERARRLAFHRPGDQIKLVTPEDSVVGAYRGLDDLGRLVLETESGPRSFAAGEVVNA